MWQGREDFECSGEWTGFVPGEQDPDPTQVEVLSAISAAVCDTI